MSKEKMKELLICLIAVFTLVFILTTHVFATADINSLLDNSDDEEEVEDATDDGDDLDDLDDENTNVNNSINNSVNNTTNNTNANVNKTKYPDTGVDYSIVFVIVVCGVSTVYAYKKIKDYNNL